MNESMASRLGIDRVLCLTLDGERQRQQNAHRELSRLGFDQFEFFHGITPNSEPFAEMTARYPVMTYPPCFRCGQQRCACDNNFLTDPQLAVFFSYIQLWKKLATSDWRAAMIVEDDIAFTRRAKRDLRRSASQIKDRLQQDESGKGVLIRLGWAKCREHAPLLPRPPKLLPGRIRMANPCHIMNRNYAIRLLEHLETIDTTADMYCHWKMAQRANHYSLFPPPAYEHSWSTGRFPSTIRPENVDKKPVWGSLLRNATSSSAETAVRPDRPPQRINTYPILAVGHPRCGSGYMAKLLTQLGIPTGHERFAEQGISSWMFAVSDRNYPFALDERAKSDRFSRFQYRIHHIRDPFQAIPSVILENTVPASYQFRRRHILSQFDIDLDQYKDPVVRAIATQLYWNRIIEQSKPDVTFRIEDDVAVLQQQLEALGIATSPRGPMPSKTVNSDKKFNGRQIDRPVVRPADLSRISEHPELESLLRDFCQFHGYDSVILFVQ